jgi:dihydroxyacetone kinase phosphoprotein-dependent L subunit
MSHFKPKLVNDPSEVADELFDGLIAASNGRCYKVGVRSIVKNDIADGKVALLVGGGAGHEPIYHGLVGTNMADGAACGDIFAAPAPNIVHKAATAVDRDNGVLFLYGNYAGDVMNFDLGAELAAAEGVNIQTVLIADDVAAAPPDRKQDRRGIAGLIPIVKIVAAASQTAENLDELASTARKACLQTRSIGAAMSPGSIPATGQPTFELDDGLIGLGMGIHGEAGVRNIPMTTADELTPMMLDLLFEDFENDAEVDALTAGDEILFFINSLGATTMMECLICMRKATEYFQSKGIGFFDVIVGPLVTCQEMAGISFSITRVDDELKRHWSLPCQSVGYSKMAGPDPVDTLAASDHASSAKTTNTGARVITTGAELELSKSSEGLTLDETRAMVLAVANAIIDAEPILSDADRALGDGDHGVGMQRGFRALIAAVEAGNPTELRELYQIAGNALLTTMGGASGVVFGLLFLVGGKTLHGATHFGSHELSHLLNQALGDVMKRGGAKPGDKTMIDALAPAAAAAIASIEAPLRESIVAVASAADAGKEASKDMIASMGRARVLGDRSLGLPDAGAISVSIILATMRDSIVS